MDKLESILFNQKEINGIQNSLTHLLDGAGDWKEEDVEFLNNLCDSFIDRINGIQTYAKEQDDSKGKLFRK